MAYDSYSQSIDFDLDSGLVHAAARRQEAENPLLQPAAYATDVDRIDEVLAKLESEMK